VFPIDLKAEEVDIELPGLGFVEDSKNRCCSAKTHAPDLLMRQIRARFQPQRLILA
jgi:hypothetical protein